MTLDQYDSAIDTLAAFVHNLEELLQYWRSSMEKTKVLTSVMNCDDVVLPIMGRLSEDLRALDESLIEFRDLVCTYDRERWDWILVVGPNPKGGRTL